MKNKKILILGITGMLGHVLFYHLSDNHDLEVFGTIRNPDDVDKWFLKNKKNIIPKIHADDLASIRECIEKIHPGIVINCIGIIKQLPMANDPMSAISINALFPHQVANFCKDYESRMLHISTDCIFTGKNGDYKENDISDAEDLYGRTKFLGEISNPHCITLRTSIIGHELKGKYGLLEWFLSQNEKIQGYTNAIFSGLPTIEIAHIISEHIIPDENFNGVYHVSSNPISKFELLNLVAKRYNKNIEIEQYEGVRENRSLNSTLFQNSTGYTPPSWEKLVDKMYRHYLTSSCYQHN